MKKHSRAGRTLLALILLFSLGLSVAAIVQFQRSPFSQVPILDEWSYVSWGKEIASGDVIGREAFYQDPLYPYFLGLVFSLSSDNFLLVRILQAGMALGSVILVFLLGQRLWGERTGLLAAAVLALYSGLYFYELLLLKASLIIFLSSLCLWLGVRAADRPGSKTGWVLLGICVGALSLLRGNFLVLIPLAVIWAAFCRQGAGWRRGLVPAGAAVLGVALMLAPVTIRNYLVSGELVLVTSQGGPNFYIGNNEHATGTYAFLPFVRPNPRWEAADFKREAERLSGRELSRSQVSKFWYEEAGRWIRKHPVRAARLDLYKARLLIHQFEIPDNHNLYFIRERFVSSLWLSPLGFGMLWGPAIIGALVWMRRDRRVWFPALFGIIYAGSIIPFFVVSRYRLALVPVLAVFSAAFMVWALDKARSGRLRALGGAAVFVLASFWLGLWPTSRSREPMTTEYRILADAYLAARQPERALEYYKLAGEAMPGDRDVIKNQGAARRLAAPSEYARLVNRAAYRDLAPKELVELGRKAEEFSRFDLAAELYERALERDPGLAEPRRRLAEIYRSWPELKNHDRMEKGKAISH